MDINKDNPDDSVDSAEVDRRLNEELAQMEFNPDDYEDDDKDSAGEYAFGMNSLMG